MSDRKTEKGWPKAELQKIASEQNLDVSESDIQTVAEVAELALQEAREQLQRGAGRR